MIRPSLAFWNREICPYCFEPFRLRQSPFRCSSPDAVCAPEVDPVRREVWGDDTPLGRVLEPAGAFGRDQRCPECNRASRQRICPACHMDLPHTMGQFESLIFAVIGAKESGKSHYIAVLIDQLRKHHGPRMGMLLEELDDETIERYRKDFHRPLFEERQALRGTVSALAERRVSLPLVYSLTFWEHGLFGGQRIRRVVNLVFFDTAGEDLDDEDVMGTVNKYIYRSHGLILLLDPLQLAKVRRMLETGLRLPEVNTETRDILNRVTRLVRRGRDLSSRRQIDTPLAIAFSKFDAVEPVAHQEMQVFHQADHAGGFDRQDFDAVHAEMTGLLAEWDSDEIFNQATTNYRHHGLFGLSALGMSPGESQQVPHVLPRRVADPFLWLLYRHGLLPASDGSYAVARWRRVGGHPAVQWLLLALAVSLLVLVTVGML